MFDGSAVALPTVLRIRIPGISALEAFEVVVSPTNRCVHLSSKQ